MTVTPPIMSPKNKFRSVIKIVLVNSSFEHCYINLLKIWKNFG